MSSHNIVDLMCLEQSEVRTAINDRMLREDTRIIGNLLQHEEQYMPPASYFRNFQTDIQPHMRRMAAEWMLEVCEECGCEEDVFILAMNYMDRFLCVKVIRKTSLQLLGAACLFVASKLKDSQPLSTYKLVSYTDNSITVTQLLEYESMLLQLLKWDVSGTTPLDFVGEILNRLMPWLDERKMQLLKCHARAFVTVCAADINLMLTPHSMIACCCVVVACKGLAIMEESRILQLLHNITRIEVDCLRATKLNVETSVKTDLQGLSPSNRTSTSTSTGKADLVQQPATPTEVQYVEI